SASTKLHTHTSSAPASRLRIATRAGSASALKRAARSSASAASRAGVVGPQQRIGRVFIDIYQYNERRTPWRTTAAPAATATAPTATAAEPLCRVVARC